MKAVYTGQGSQDALESGKYPGSISPSRSSMTQPPQEIRNRVLSIYPLSDPGDIANKTPVYLREHPHALL